MTFPSRPELGLRQRKNRDTRRRVAEASLRLYMEKGYAGTTLAEIARAAEISPRTLFLHFPTKEDTLKYWRQEAFADLLPAIMAEQSPDLTPLTAAQKGLLGLIATQDPAHSANIDRLMESNEALWAHSQAILIQLEDSMLEAMVRLWPQRYPRAVLRMAAMVSIGVMRIAMGRWRDDGATRPIATYVTEEFAVLPRVLSASWGA